MDFRFDIILEYLPLLLKGTLWTIGISILSILFRFSTRVGGWFRQNVTPWLS